MRGNGKLAEFEMQRCHCALVPDSSKVPLSIAAFFSIVYRTWSVFFFGVGVLLRGNVEVNSAGTLSAAARSLYLVFLSSGRI